MAGNNANTASLDKALGTAIPLLRSGGVPASLNTKALEALSPDARLVTWVLDDWPVADLERWQEAIGLHSTSSSAPLHAVSVRTATASALWKVIVERSEEEPFEATLAVLRLWFEGLFPLVLNDPQQITGLPRAPAQRALGLTLGLMAWRGFRTAMMLVRSCLAGDTGGARLRRALLTGLAGGLPNQVLPTLVDRIHRSLSDRDEWRLAGTQTLPWIRGGVEAPDQVFELMGALLDSSTAQGEALQLVTGLLTYPGTTDTAEAWLCGQWQRWPSQVRAALITGKLGGIDPAMCFLDRSPPVIHAALDTFDSTLDAPAIDRLKTLLHHPSRRVRSAISIRLAHERAPSAVQKAVLSEDTIVVALPPAILARTPLDKVRAAFSLDEPETIPAQCQSVGADEVDQVRTTLRSALTLPDVAARRAAVDALAKVGTKEDVPVLLDAARRVRGLETIVAAAITKIDAPPGLDELAELFHRRLKWADDEAVDHYVALVGEDAASELTRALQTLFYPPARIGAARALARHGFKTAIFSLRTRSLTDPNKDARSAAAKALEALSGAEIAHDVIAGYEALHAPIDVLDRAADRGRQGGRKAIPGLRYCLANGSWRRRVISCEVLGALPGVEAREVLIEAMLDPDEDVRLAARHALAAHGWTPNDDRNFTLAAAAERHLERLLLAPQRADTEVLEGCLALGGHVFRTEIVGLLSRLEELGIWTPSERIVPSLRLTALDPEAALKSEGGVLATLLAIDRTWQLHPHRAKLAHGLLGLTANELADCDPDNILGWRAQEAICYAMGHIADADAIAYLGRQVLDPDEDVRTAALDALVLIGSTEAADAIATGTRSPFQEDTHGVAEALAALGTPALPTLRRLAASSWWEERRAAAVALVHWRGDRQAAVDMALPMAVDSEYRVAEAAREALLRHGLQPGPDAVQDTLRRTTPVTLVTIEPWLGLDSEGHFVHPAAGTAFDAHLQGLTTDELTHRVALAGQLHRQELRGWITDLASGAATDHVGLRLAATATLRVLDSDDCHLCKGRGLTPCVGCNGDGETRCDMCVGEGTTRTPCPEPGCTARERTRAIRSLTCKTCRGRGAVVRPCGCANGFVPCVVCHGGGRALCLGCNGSGKLGRTTRTTSPGNDA